jgi:hypothetical protein
MNIYLVYHALRCMYVAIVTAMLSFRYQLLTLVPDT